MTSVKLLSASLIAMTMLAAPALAQENFVARHHSVKADAGVASPPWLDRHVLIMAPHVGESDTAPEVPGGVCDAGDNPGIC